ncbi:flavoprotein [Aspergillus oleicola]
MAFFNRNSPAEPNDDQNNNPNSHPHLPSTLQLQTQQPQHRSRIIIALTGATGSVLGIQTLLTLRRLNIETHLMISKWAEATIKYETDYTIANVRGALADHVYSNADLAAPIASGSFKVDLRMIIVPCSAKTLAAISGGLCDDLITRAADVVLKERRRLVLAVRETPLSSIHLRNTLQEWLVECDAGADFGIWDEWVISYFEDMRDRAAAWLRRRSDFLEGEWRDVVRSARRQHNADPSPENQLELEAAEEDLKVILKTIENILDRITSTSFWRWLT